MDVNVNAVNHANVNSAVYSKAANKTTAKADTAAAESTKASEAAQRSGVVYEKGTQNTNTGLYKINKMSQEDRTKIAEQLKADMEKQQQSLIDMVSKMMNKQGATASIANGEDDNSIWHFLSEGNFTVDAATKAQAQEDISEDGYWGVKQTSQRLFDFASALAGDDVEKMKKMQDAMMKGFDQATKAWGKELPQISQDTISAANKLFDDYYASKNQATTEQV